MSSLGRSYACVNIVWVNIGVLTGWKKIKLRRISFVLGYLRMIFLWKISTAISIKHRILTNFNIKKNSVLTACMPLILKWGQMGWLKKLVILYSSSSFIGNSSDKLRRVSLQNWFSLSEKLSNPSFFKYNILSSPYFTIYLRYYRFDCLKIESILLSYKMF